MKLFCAERGGFGASEAAYTLLRHAVSSLYGIEFPEIEKAPSGKPYFPNRPDIHFSLSHTKTHVLAGVSGAPIGVDVETIRAVRPDVAARVCTPDELSMFDFFELWVLKESFIKVTGNTRVRLRDICFKRDGGRVETMDETVNARLFSTIPGCAAAVCSKGSDIPGTILWADLSKILGKS